MLISREVYSLSWSSTIMQAIWLSWLIKYNPALMPIVINGVAIASASSALGLMMVTLFMPLTGKPFLELTALKFLPAIDGICVPLFNEVATAILLITTLAKGRDFCEVSAVAIVQGLSSGCAPHASRSPPALITPLLTPLICSTYFARSAA